MVLFFPFSFWYGDPKLISLFTSFVMRANTVWNILYLISQAISKQSQTCIDCKLESWYMLACACIKTADVLTAESQFAISHRFKSMERYTTSVSLVTFALSDCTGSHQVVFEGPFFISHHYFYCAKVSWCYAKDKKSSVPSCLFWIFLSPCLVQEVIVNGVKVIHLLFQILVFGFYKFCLIIYWIVFNFLVKSGRLQLLTCLRVINNWKRWGFAGIISKMQILAVDFAI